MKLAVIDLNCATVLHAAMVSLHFAVALDSAENARRGNRKRDDKKRQKEDRCKQNVALLGMRDGATNSVRSCVAADWG